MINKSSHLAGRRWPLLICVSVSELCDNFAVPSLVDCSLFKVSWKISQEVEGSSKTGHERVMRSLVMDRIVESVPRMQLVFDPAPFLAFQSYWERTIRLGWTQLLSWNSPLLHMTTVVILWYAIMQHRNVYISLQVSQKNLWSRTCINTVYQALSPIFRVPGNKAKCTLQWSVKVTSSSAWQFCIGSLLPEGCC